MSNDTFGYRIPSLLPSQGTSEKQTIGDTSHLREREITISQVPGGYILTLSGGGVRYHKRVAPNEDVLVAIVRGHFSGALEEKEDH